MNSNIIRKCQLLLAVYLSAQDGQRDAAMNLINRFMAKHKLSWEEITQDSKVLATFTGLHESSESELISIMNDVAHDADDKEFTEFIKAQWEAMRKTHRGVLNTTVGGKLDGRGQHRYVGQRHEKNQFGHCLGTIGAKIDELLLAGRYTRKQLAALAGTKLSKINSHISHLRRDCGVRVLSVRGGENWIEKDHIWSDSNK